MTQTGMIYYHKFKQLLIININVLFKGAKMEIVRVEPTPSPNTMKIVLSEKRR